MLIRILKLPIRIVKKAVKAVQDGGRDAPPPPPPRRAPPPARRPAPRPEVNMDRGHSHSHDHGHSHDHDHDHGHGESQVEVRFEETPNPNALKFTTSVKVSSQPLTFSNGEGDHPLAERLFAIPGVVSVFAVNDFVTVTKADSVSWGGLTRPIIQGLQDVLGE